MSVEEGRKFRIAIRMLRTEGEKGERRDLCYSNSRVDSLSQIGSIPRGGYRISPRGGRLIPRHLIEEGMPSISAFGGGGGRVRSVWIRSNRLTRVQFG